MDWQAFLTAAQGTLPPADRLADVVGGVWSGATVRDVAPLLGGLGSVLHRLDLTGAPVDAVVLRQLLPEFGDDAATVRREVAVHEAASGVGIPVPSVHWSDPEGRVFGRPALLLDFVPGRQMVAGLTTQAGRGAMASALHSLRGVPTPASISPRLHDLEAVLQHLPPSSSSEVVDAAGLRAAIDTVAGAFEPGGSVVHMDLHGGNVLWDGTDVTGILDWSNVALGNPLVDETYLWFDACLAHGQDVADEVQRTVDVARPGPAPRVDEVRLWRGVALQRGLPSPRPWAEAYRAGGVDIDDDTVEERFVVLVEEYIEGI